MLIPRFARAATPIAFGAILALSACASRPDIAARIDPAALAAPVPSLVPLAPLLAAADGIAAAPVAGLPAARVTALAARAARLRGPVIDPATRARMEAAIRRDAQVRGD